MKLKKVWTFPSPNIFHMDSLLLKYSLQINTDLLTFVARLSIKVRDNKEKDRRQARYFLADKSIYVYFNQVMTKFKDNIKLQALICRTIWMLCNKPTVNPSKDVQANLAKVNNIPQKMRQLETKIKLLLDTEIKKNENNKTKSKKDFIQSNKEQILIKYMHYVKGALNRIQRTSKRNSCTQN